MEFQFFVLQLLNRQVGVVNFAPLKPLFLAIHRSSRLFLPGAPSLAALEVYLRRNPEQSEARSALPVSALSLESIKSGELAAAFAAFMRAKFADSAACFRRVLHSLLFVVANSQAEANQVESLSGSHFSQSASWSDAPFLLAARACLHLSRVPHWVGRRDRTKASWHRKHSTATRAGRPLHPLQPPTASYDARPPVGDGYFQPSQELCHGGRLCKQAGGAWTGSKHCPTGEASFL